jgi:hypothetical protein
MSASESAHPAHDPERVRVDRLELDRATPPSTLARIAACVTLDDLLPVDVEVELTIEGGPDASLAEVRTERMWSAYPFHSHRFLFESHVPDEAIARARRIAVRIHPAGTSRAGRQHGEPPHDCLIPAVELDLAPRAEDGP